MSEIIKFEDGETAFLRDPRSVPNKYRNPVKDAQMAVGLYGSEIEEIEDEREKRLATARMIGQHHKEFRAVDDALVLALVEKWSYEFPVSVENLDELPGHAYDKLVDVTKPKLKELFPNFQYVKAEDDPTEDSPTLPSGD